mmetsp:Transcript_18570/g.38948  ORF Transcript_18570/g.38948 Transcript_18570/m.38948 type:complete len:282 (-) Transcript_18570:215-1060(-)
MLRQRSKRRVPRPTSLTCSFLPIPSLLHQTRPRLLHPPIKYLTIMHRRHHQNFRHIQIPLLRKNPPFQLGKPLPLADTRPGLWTHGRAPHHYQIHIVRLVQRHGFAVLSGPLGIGQCLDGQSGGDVVIVFVKRGEESGAEAGLRREEGFVGGEDEVTDAALGGVGVDFYEGGGLEFGEGGEVFGGEVGVEEVGDSVVYRSGKLSNIVLLHKIPNRPPNPPFPRSPQPGILFIRHLFHLVHGYGIFGQSVGFVARFVESCIGGSVFIVRVCSGETTVMTARR